MLRTRGMIVLVFLLLVMCMALTTGLLLRELGLPDGYRITTENGSYVVSPGEAPAVLTKLTDNKRLFTGLRERE